MQILLGLVVGLVFFCATIAAYAIGVKHGRIVRSDGVPNINPIKVIQQHKQEKEAKEQQDLFRTGLSNLLNFGEIFERKE